MSDSYTAESEESLFKRQRSYIGDNLAHEQIGDNAPSTYSASLHSALSTRGLGGRGNGEMTVETMRGAQATYGNRAVQRYLGGRRSAISGQVSIQRWPSFIKPYMDQILGKEPDKQEEQDKPERKPRGPVYAGENEAGGYEQGMEGVTGSSSLFGIPISVIFGQSQLQAGRWGESGARRSGFKAEGELLRTTINGGSTVSGEVGLGTARAEASAGEDGATLGAQANSVEASLTLGRFSRDRRNDEQVRAGVSSGGGAEVRAHWGDGDKDGRRGYGFGFDVGPASFDVMTEDPLHTLDIKGRAARGLASLAESGVKDVSSYILGIQKIAQIQIEKELEEERARKEREATIAREIERKREVESRLFGITSRAGLGGAEVSPDDIATQVGQDRRLQFLLKASMAKCYE